MGKDVETFDDDFENIGLNEEVVSRSPTAAENKYEARRKLEALMEQRKLDRLLDDFYD
ncbi:MAG: hypothetical protein KUG55_07210 [Cycloclasticus sp.]|jgi:hypothetical protein|nr:hypothetical protein [Cycloclasticus sp.]MDF1689537.1 hypothetical protein [Cycloclasticus sp.]MEE4290765.1 hypothetical protein [Cycloclasticus sp.]